MKELKSLLLIQWHTLSFKRHNKVSPYLKWKEKTFYLIILLNAKENNQHENNNTFIFRV